VIPTRLEDWTLEALQTAADSGVNENDIYDFKADLQPADHQRKSVAAFANTRGGFLIFGVTNDRKLEGIANEELPRDFGIKLKTGLEPSVEYRFREPLEVSSGKNIFVVEVPRSLRVPHAVALNGNWTFLKRTPAGNNDPMSYEEVRLAFQDTETRRTKLALLSSELSHIGWVAERLLREIPENSPTDGLVNDWAWMTRYPTTLVDTILGDAYSLFADKTDIQGALAMLRDETRRSNEVAAVYSNYEFIRSTKDPQQRKKLYETMRQSASTIRSVVRNAKKMVDAVLSGNYGRLLDVVEAASPLAHSEESR
jgi:hypothetical protein